MALKVIGISASPREKGNSDLLLREALAGAESAGAQAEYISLRGKKISPCTECHGCYESGQCVIKDDFQNILAKMLDADRLIIATPIFFMAVSAQCKMLIDRCQCLWSKKYVLKEPLYPNGPCDRRAMVIAVGGTKSTRMFDSIRLTMKYFFDVLEVHYAANLFVNKVDKAGAILNHPTAMNEARRLGAGLGGRLS